jgi:hypothetical protein
MERLVMGIFDKITKEQTLVPVYTLDDSTLIDSKEFMKKHDVSSLAKQAAKQNLPRTEAKSSDSNELSIRQKVNEEAIKVTMRLNQGISDLDNRIAGVESASVVSKIENFGKTFHKEIKSEVTSETSSILELRREVSECEEEFRSFKANNQLDHSPQYKDSNLLKIGVLLVALVFESVFNSFLFAQANDFGLLGGGLQAALISMINISIGFIAGMWPYRRKNHINPKIAYPSLFAFAAIVLTLFVFNLLVAHYREALVLDPDNAAIVAMQSFRSGIFALQDIQSWFLFLVGLIISVIAIVEGYKWDDPYPGYGALDRKLKQLKDDLDSKKKDCIEKIEEIYEEYTNDLDVSYKDISRFKQNLVDFSKSIERQVEQHKALLQHLRNLCEIAVTSYRDVNSANRETQPPEYFHDPIDFSFDLEPLKPVKTDKLEKLDREIQQVAVLRASLEQEFLKVKDENKSKISKL